MWLLDTQDNDTPRLRSIREIDLEADPKTGFPRIQYAIFSHTWAPDDEQEISFDDIQSGNFSRTSTGWRKIRHCRRQAAQDGLEYAWIDTCCIDKRSSAELQEAINSMFHWYSRSNVCYVFLTDVSKAELDLEELATHENCKHLKARDRGVKLIDNAFTRSLWFSRGWTLQELLAPKHVHFYDKDWQLLGNKRSLQCWISRAAGIDGDILRGDYSLQQCSVAMRLSWAAGRETTRIEDRAYSLLGLFDVNMPMLYGEGQKAFMRLQEEIIKMNDDHSIFIWKRDDIDPSHIGMLAPNLDAFKGKGEHTYHNYFPSEGFSLSNRGLSIKMPLIQYSLDTYIAVLSCGLVSDGATFSHGLFLRRLGDRKQYGRVRFQGRHSIKVNEDLPPSKSIYVRQRPLSPSELYYLDDHGYKFFVAPSLLSPSSEDPTNIYFGQHSSCAITQPTGVRAYPIAILSIRHLRLDQKWLSLGFDDDFHPVVVLSDTFSILMHTAGGIDLTDYEFFDIEKRNTDLYHVARSAFGPPALPGSGHEDFLNDLKFPTFIHIGLEEGKWTVKPVQTNRGTYWGCKCFRDVAHLDLGLAKTGNAAQARGSSTVKIRIGKKGPHWQIDVDGVCALFG